MRGLTKLVNDDITIFHSKLRNIRNYIHDAVDVVLLQKGVLDEEGVDKIMANKKELNIAFRQALAYSLKNRGAQKAQSFNRPDLSKNYRLAKKLISLRHQIHDVLGVVLKELNLYKIEELNKINDDIENFKLVFCHSFGIAITEHHVI